MAAKGNMLLVGTKLDERLVWQGGRNWTNVFGWMKIGVW